MGYLLIELGGSFPRRRVIYDASRHGHAHTVAEAIEYLSSTILPAAIEQDHRLHARGEQPTEGFGRPTREPDAASLRESIEFALEHLRRDSVRGALAAQAVDHLRRAVGKGGA